MALQLPSFSVIKARFSNIKQSIKRAISLFAQSFKSWLISHKKFYSDYFHAGKNALWLGHYGVGDGDLFPQKTTGPVSNKVKLARVITFPVMLLVFVVAHLSSLFYEMGRSVFYGVRHISNTLLYATNEEDRKKEPSDAVSDPRTKIAKIMGYVTFGAIICAIAGAFISIVALVKEGCISASLWIKKVYDALLLSESDNKESDERVIARKIISAPLGVVLSAIPVFVLAMISLCTETFDSIRYGTMAVWDVLINGKPADILDSDKRSRPKKMMGYIPVGILIVALCSTFIAIVASIKDCLISAGKWIKFSFNVALLENNKAFKDTRSNARKIVSAPFAFALSSPVLSVIFLITWLKESIVLTVNWLNRAGEKLILEKEASDIFPDRSQKRIAAGLFLGTILAAAPMAFVLLVTWAKETAQSIRFSSLIVARSLFLGKTDASDPRDNYRKILGYLPVGAIIVGIVALCVAIPTFFKEAALFLINKTKQVSNWVNGKNDEIINEQSKVRKLLALPVYPLVAIVSLALIIAGSFRSLYLGEKGSLATNSPSKWDGIHSPVGKHGGSIIGMLLGTLLIPIPFVGTYLGYKMGKAGLKNVFQKEYFNEFIRPKIKSFFKYLAMISVALIFSPLVFIYRKVVKPFYKVFREIARLVSLKKDTAMNERLKKRKISSAKQRLLGNLIGFLTMGIAKSILKAVTGKSGRFPLKEQLSPTHYPEVAVENKFKQLFSSVDAGGALDINENAIVELKVGEGDNPVSLDIKPPSSFKNIGTSQTGQQSFSGKFFRELRREFMINFDSTQEAMLKQVHAAYEQKLPDAVGALMQAAEWASFFKEKISSIEADMKEKRTSKKEQKLIEETASAMKAHFNFE